MPRSPGPRRAGAITIVTAHREKRGWVCDTEEPPCARVMAPARLRLIEGQLLAWAVGATPVGAGAGGIRAPARGHPRPLQGDTRAPPYSLQRDPRDLRKGTPPPGDAHGGRPAGPALGGGRGRGATSRPGGRGRSPSVPPSLPRSGCTAMLRAQQSRDNA